MRAAPILLIVLACLPAALAAGAASRQSMTTWSGVYSREQAEDGEVIYLDRCAGCHQPDLSGGEDAPALAGAQFSAKWNDRTVGELFERTRRLMPRDAPGSLSPAQYARLVAYMLQYNGFPEGASALSDRPDALSGIRFVSHPPGG